MRSGFWMFPFLLVVAAAVVVLLVCVEPKHQPAKALLRQLLQMPDPKTVEIKQQQEVLVKQASQIITSPPPPVNLLYLEAPAARGVGLGHSFMQFNHFVTFALENNLSIRTLYQTDGGREHDFKVENVKNYFFGDQTMTPLPENINCSYKFTPIISLPDEALRAKNAEPSGCVVFTIRARKPSERGVGIHLPYYRRLFEGNEVARRSTIKRKWEQPNSRSNNVVRVAVHMRRGDLKSFLRGHLDETEIRLVHENMYTSTLNQLLMKLAELKTYHIEVRLYCEGMQPPASVPKASDWSLVDLSEMVIFNSAIQNVTFLPASEDTLEAFDEMCFSDVIITAPSGFSHLASVLCNTPVILGVPFRLSYDYIPNAITLDVEREVITVPALAFPNASLTYRASFNETQFEMLWRERFSSQ